MGLYVWYFGTKDTAEMWPDLGHHTILNGPRFTGLLRDIFMRGKLSDDMSLYIHRPSKTDPNVAPQGDDTFYVLSPVPHLGWKDAVDWQAEEPRYRDKVAAQLETVMPGFRDSATATCRPMAAGFLSSRGFCKARGSAPIMSARRPVASTSSAPEPIPAQAFRALSPAPRSLPAWCPTRPRHKAKGWPQNDRRNRP